MNDLTAIELFAGAGGMALGFERAGICHAALIENNAFACETMRLNRPDWPVVQADVRTLDYRKYRGVDIVAGGFPCQPFSTAGKQRGFDDARGTLIFDMLRAVSEVKPKLVVAENVPRLLTLNDGEILSYIVAKIRELGYETYYDVLNAADYGVAQSRKRLFIVGVRTSAFTSLPTFPTPTVDRPVTLQQCLDGVPYSDGYEYNDYVKSVFDLVPAGGNWRDLPVDVAKEYMGGLWDRVMAGDGGNSGTARRLAWDKPSPVILTSILQKFDARCHPDVTRPLTPRECARIQDFPDSWRFHGSIRLQHRQVGNAVPPTLAETVGRYLYSVLDPTTF